MAGVENDSFANKIPITQELPFKWSGQLGNSSKEAWWEWTSPKDGRISITPIPKELSYSNNQRISVHTLLSPTQSEITKISSEGTLDVAQGKTYYFQISNSPFELSEITIEWIDHTKFPQNRFINFSTIISESDPVITTKNYGNLDVESYWYKWRSSRAGTVVIESIESEFYMPTNIFVGPDDKNLFPVYQFRNNSFRAKEGSSYWIQIPVLEAQKIVWQIRPGPEGDNFLNSPSLPSTNIVTWEGTTKNSGLELEEPYIGDYLLRRRKPSVGSVWRTWTAPTTGSYQFSSLQLWALICQGSKIDGLKVITEGNSGTLDAISGQQYHISVHSPNIDGDLFTFHLSKLNDSYIDWSFNYFTNESIESAPLSDPDGDSRNNLMEMALGTNPLTPDGGTPIWISERNGSLSVNLLRKYAVPEISYQFEISEDLVSWEILNIEDEEITVTPTPDGQQILNVRLNESFSSKLRMQVRLRVDLID